MTSKIEKEALRLAEVVPRLMSAFHDFQRPHEGTETLTMRHFQALVLLSVRGEMTVMDLCERLHLAPSTGSELMQRMITLGFVQKSYDSADKREVTLKLTKLGMEMFLKRKQEMVQVFQALLERFSDKDRQRLVSSFETIFEIMSSLHQPRG
jgi:MarR family transcriptional regulator, organic hydroperoxide resistance regulator